jgi:hypothetical protein
MICWRCHSNSVNTGSRLPYLSDVKTRKRRNVVGIDIIRKNRIKMYLTTKRHISIRILLCTLTPEVQCFTFYRNYVKMIACFCSFSKFGSCIGLLTLQGKNESVKDRYQLNYFICIKNFNAETITSFNLNLFCFFICCYQHHERKTICLYIFLISDR